MPCGRLDYESGDVFLERSKRSCRACGHYVRVWESWDKMPNNRGFCVLGNLDGDWGLYVSSNEGLTCKGYIGDPYNLETLRLETELNKEWIDIKHNLLDGRKKLTRKLSKAIPDLSDIFKNAKKQRNVMGYMGDFQMGIGLVWKWFNAEHEPKFQVIRKRTRTRKTSYYQVLGDISLAMVKWIEAEKAQDNGEPIRNSGNMITKNTAGRRK